jgi:hypothetical protein
MSPDNSRNLIWRKPITTARRCSCALGQAPSRHTIRQIRRCNQPRPRCNRSSIRRPYSWRASAAEADAAAMPAPRQRSFLNTGRRWRNWPKRQPASTKARAVKLCTKFYLQRSKPDADITDAAYSRTSGSRHKAALRSKLRQAAYRRCCGAYPPPRHRSWRPHTASTSPHFALVLQVWTQCVPVRLSGD